jgi:hypothetical protein
MLLRMRRRTASIAAACMLCWTACEDRTFDLSQPLPTTGSDSGGNTSATQGLMIGSGGTVGGDAAANNNATNGSPTSGGGSGSVNGFGPSSITTDAGGSNPKGGPNDGNVGAGGSGANGNIPEGGAGGQGPDLICTQGIATMRLEEYCAAPTLDCEQDRIWDENCRYCNPNSDVCPSISMGALRCFEENAKCLPACGNNDDCDTGTKCHPEAQVCVSCYQDEHCPDDRFSHCLAGQCHECRVSEDCIDAGRGRYCIAGLCRRCLSSDDCEPGQFCAFDGCTW